jgi:hypothetical protein
MTRIDTFDICKITRPEEAIVGSLGHAMHCIFVTSFGLKDPYIDSETGFAYLTLKGKKYRIHTEEVQME